MYNAPMSKILVAGSLAYDRIMDFPGLFSEHLMPDKLHALSVSFTVDRLGEGFGGTAGNIAYNFALLNEAPILAASAGYDFDKYKKWLKRCAIESASVQVAADTATAVAHVITDKADNQISAFYMGAMTREWKGEIPNDTALAIVSAGNKKDMSIIPAKCRKKRIKYFFDPAQAVTALSKNELRSGIDGAEVLFGNDYEMEMIIQKTEWGVDDLLKRVPILVTTLGAQGSLITTREKTYRIAPVKIKKPVDPTGAGDAYRAGFAKGFVAGLPLQEAGQLASAVASYAVEAHGTQNHKFTMAELRKRYKKAYGEKLKI